VVTVILPVVQVVLITGVGQLMLPPHVIDWLAGANILSTLDVGGLTTDGAIVTVIQQLFVFPHASVARKHTCVAPIGNEEPLAGPVICTTLSVPVCVQVVLAVAWANVTAMLVAPAAAVMLILAGQLIVTGDTGGLTVLAVTVTLIQQLVLVPHASTARKQTWVVPTGNAEPLAGPVICVTVTVPDVVHVVVAVAFAKVAIAVVAPVVAVTFTFAGQVMVTTELTGGVTGAVTTTLIQQLVLVPHASTALKHTWVVPTGNAEPLAGPVIRVTVTALDVVHVVVAVAFAKVAIAVVAPAAAVKLTFAGQEIVTTELTGGVTVAVTTTLMQQLVLVPHASTALKHTWVVPTGKAEPLAGPVIRVTVTALPVVHVVVAVGVAKVATAVVEPAAVVILTFAGQVIVTTELGAGGTEAVTVIRAVAVDELPHISTAVQVRVIVDAAGQAPPVVTSVK
jgi:hypothetical protein